MSSSDNSFENYPYIYQLPSPNKVTGKLIFKRAFRIIAVSIFAIQIYSIIALAMYDFEILNLPDEYYLKSEITSLFWYFIMTLVIIWDITRVNISPLYLFKIELEKLIKHLPQVLKYFAGCGAAVITMELLFPSTPEAVINNNPTLIILSFITTVIAAPICEEIAFRGYLYTAMIPVFKRERERLVVNAMLFAAGHIFLIAFLLGAVVPYYIFIIGYFLAKLYNDSRSILPGIALHALNNGLVFAIEFYRMM